MSLEIPQSVRLLLDEYAGLVHEALPGFLAGLYLHGSVALGAFDPRWSDIDFIAVTSRGCTRADLHALRGVHHTLARRHPRPRLEGSYLQWCDLGRYEDTMPPRPRIHEGILRSRGYHDINAVTWWMLKNRGLALVGPAPDQLDLPVEWQSLIAAMHHNMNTYWARFITSPRRVAWLLTDRGIQWTVLGVLRQFYTFRENDITSKIGAGIYALEHTPAQWHALIQQAIDIRSGTHAFSWRFRLARAATARAFLQYIIAQCNADMP